MELEWTVYVKRRGSKRAVPIGTFQRPVTTAKPADFGLSIPEARALLASLQRVVGQEQIHAYDAERRPCRHCEAYRRIKDWRSRSFATGLGDVSVRVPRVISCLCTPEPLSEEPDDEEHFAKLRFSGCHLDKMLPRRRTPEIAYLCAKLGAAASYRTAASKISELTGIRSLCHASVRKEVIASGEYIEEEQFRIGWFAGGTKPAAAAHLRVAIDGTVLTGTDYEVSSKIEVIAGRVERDGGIGRRFACALPFRPVLARMLVAAALEQSGWTRETVVDVITDGARGMRALVTAVAPQVAPKILDWFHLSMKLQAVRRPLCSRTYYPIDRPAILTRCERFWPRIRDALWRGKGRKAIVLIETLIKTLKQDLESFPWFYRQSASTAIRASEALLLFLKNNLRDLVDYQRARMGGRRISTASAESVMNQVVNRRLSKRQQMRWTCKGAHNLLLTRVEMLDGRLAQHFAARFPHFRTPDLRVTAG